MSKQTYSNDEITVTWDSKVCFHSEVCVKNLNSVFDINKKPWINLDGDTKEKIIDLINTCPSGALQYKLPNEDKMESTEETKITVAKDGPILVRGHFTVQDSDGQELEVEKNVALCRCGASTNKPFCDGSHKKVEFQG